MNTALQIYNFKQNQVRTTMIDGEPYFCCLDICQAINLKNNRDVIARLKGGVVTTDTPTDSGIQPMSYISEKNLYKVVLQSRKPEAEPFVDWVCGEVLPSIRKTGSYGMQKPTMPFPICTAYEGHAFEETIRRVVAEAFEAERVYRYEKVPSDFQHCYNQAYHGIEGMRSWHRGLSNKNLTMREKVLEAIK